MKIYILWNDVWPQRSLKVSYGHFYVKLIIFRYLFCLKSQNFLWMLTLWRCILFMKLIMSSKVIKGHMSFTFMCKNRLSLRYICWLKPNPIKKAKIVNMQISIKWSMTSKFIEGHIKPRLTFFKTNVEIYTKKLLLS